MRGEEETGVTTFFLQDKVDTGSILLQARVRIGPDDTAGELHDRLADLGAEVVLQTVRAIEVGNVKPVAQDEASASLAPKIFREDCEINWNKPAVDIHNFVRGLSPSPCAWTNHHEKVLRVYRTERVEEAGTLTEHEAGLVADVRGEKLIVRTAAGLIALAEVQQEGRKRMGVAEFLRGHPLKVGDRLGEL
jgi:methionyl-tRNA formyltransferase